MSQDHQIQLFGFFVYDCVIELDLLAKVSFLNHS